ncbi:MAG: thiol:disulfide interchange protein DsbA/DsbL [Xanthomonadaceae bacterium]|nr:thiol:disulfide interchange protein DsbA/DsbL [Xanthomonadaceae bacterium]
MMQGIARWLAALMLFATAAAVAQSGGYTTLNPPVPTSNDGTVEVREFFSYACPACAAFEPHLSAWVAEAPEEVRVVHVPVVFNESWRPFAQAYYAAEALGVVERIHRPLFQALHVEKRRLGSEKELVRFFAEQGVPEDEARAALNSFRVDMLMRQGAQAMREFRIESTPTVVVAGKYVVTPRSAGGYAEAVALIDRLVRQEIAARK